MGEIERVKERELEQAKAEARKHQDQCSHLLSKVRERGRRERESEGEG